MTQTNIPKQVLDYQRQVLEFQKAAFENGYNAIVALQERQLELADRMISQVPNLPDEARELMQTWRGAAEDGQRHFKHTVDGSFDAVTAYLDRLADGSTDSNATEQTAAKPARETEAAE